MKSNIKVNKICLCAVIIFKMTVFTSGLKAQPLTIDFNATPYVNAGNNTWNPNYFDNSGCGSSKHFGPYPLPLNGHNIRVVGAQSYYNHIPSIASSQSYYALGVYAVRNGIDPTIEVHQDVNATLSIEYNFQANKSYLIEFTGIKSEGYWTGGGQRPKRYYRPVFWVQLDDNSEINTPVANKCGWEIHPVQKKVGRYSKLISDPSMVLENKTYSVKFSPVVNKSALKIIFDPSPADPNISFDGKFSFKNVKITEIPYENDIWQSPTYSNTPRPQRGDPNYYIESEYTPAGRPGRPTRPTTKSGTIIPDNWILDYSGSGYSVYLEDLIPNMNFGEIISVSVLGDYYQDPRDGSTRRNRLNLPVSYNNNNFTYLIENNQLIMTVNNANNDKPTENIDIEVVYK